MSWVDYPKNAFKSDTAAVSKSQMILCGLATGFPILIGLYNHQESIAIYGALTGFALTVHDHVGTLKHRLTVITVTFLMLILAFFVGLHLQHRSLELFLTVGFLTYWIGLMGGEGAEFEKALLFTTIQLIVASHSLYVGPSEALPVMKYSLIGYVFVIMATVTHMLLTKPKISPFSRLFEHLRKPLASKLERHLYAVSYVVITLVGAALMDFYNVERGYWTVVTVLLVMKPDRTQSLYRSFQRFIGTALGALVSIGMVSVVHSAIPVLILITASAALVPWSIKRNYWLVSFLTSLIVILLLELPVIHNSNFHTPLMRLQATAYGCLLGVVGVLLSKILSKTLEKRF